MAILSSVIVFLAMAWTSALAAGGASLGGQLLCSAPGSYSKTYVWTFSNLDTTPATIVSAGLIDTSLGGLYQGGGGLAAGAVVAPSASVSGSASYTGSNIASNPTLQVVATWDGVTNYTFVNEQAYVLTAPPCPPTIASVTPSSGPTAGGNRVTIAGSNLSGAFVYFDGIAAAASCVPGISACLNGLYATVPAHAAGTVSVTASNAGGSSGAASYTYTDTPPTTAPGEGGGDGCDEEETCPPPADTTTTTAPAPADTTTTTAAPPAETTTTTPAAETTTTAGPPPAEDTTTTTPAAETTTTAGPPPAEDTTTTAAAAETTTSSTPDSPPATAAEEETTTTAPAETTTTEGATDPAGTTTTAEVTTTSEASSTTATAAETTTTEPASTTTEAATEPAATTTSVPDATTTTVDDEEEEEGPTFSRTAIPVRRLSPPPQPDTAKARMRATWPGTMPATAPVARVQRVTPGTGGRSMARRARR